MADQLTESQGVEVERMIDAVGLDTFLSAVALICSEKAGPRAA